MSKLRDSFIPGLEKMLFLCSFINNIHYKERCLKGKYAPFFCSDYIAPFWLYYGPILMQVLRGYNEIITSEK